jgi:soluble lytic murein transglycosylase-like protein
MWRCVSGDGYSLPTRAAFMLAVCVLFAGSARAEPPAADPEPMSDIKVAAPAAMEPPPARMEMRPAPMLRGEPVAGRDDIVALIEREAGRLGVPPEVAEAVAHTESGFNPRVIGADGEIGLMQILPSTARMLGFAGTKAELAVPETNVYYGVTYLAQAWRLAGRDLCTAVMKYRAGHGETRFSYLSVDYCLRVRARMRSRGFQVAGIVPAATFGNPVPGGGGKTARCRGRCLGGFGRGVDLAALNSQLSQISFRVTVMKVPMR